jgi:hypothetical protein
MSGYISSNNNRFYVAREATYAAVPAVTAANRFGATKLEVHQELDRPHCRPKSGTRSFAGWPLGFRKRTSYALRTHLYGWADQTKEPAYGPLFEAALGGAATLFTGAVIQSAPSVNSVRTAAGHGLALGQAVTYGNELRFVNSIADATTFGLNVPFSTALVANTVLGASATYQPASALASLSLFDCWSPTSAIQRILNGAGVDELRIKVNGDCHQFQFRGPAADVLDNITFESGQGGLSSFPAEPTATNTDGPMVPGNLGQAWLGTSPTQFFTLTAAEVVIKNNLEMRNKEFGSVLPRAIVPGAREVTATLELYQEDTSASRALYQAARSGSPISVFFQLGQAPGQLLGVWLRSVVPDLPDFDDSETRLAWTFSSARAQGYIDDEVFVAFG